MRTFDLKSKRKVHFIGIGGISMSAIALILLKNGFSVSGSDISENDNVKELERQGIKIFIGHKKENITSDIDIVVYSKAIHDDNEEIIKTKELNIKLMSRSAILGEIMANYEKRICVAGTHGKTTTTAIISKVLFDKKFDPTINVGGMVDEIGGNFHIGKDKNIFVAEACEYTNSFLDFCPNVAVVTNIEEDHLDFFKDINDIRNSFKKFISLLPSDGLLVINNEIDNISYFTNDLSSRYVTYGEDETADYYFDNVQYDELHYQSFDVYCKKKFVGRMRQRLIGKHNALNFIAGLATLMELGITFEDIKESIEEFKGAKRRLEVKKIVNGITYIDDYAHHPTEIEASLQALKEIKYNKLYLIFQPHTFTRTKALFDEFVRVLGDNPITILAKIYPAREKDTGIISSRDIVEGIKNSKKSKNIICEYFETFKNIQEYVLSNAKAGDIVVAMGAGDVNKIIDIE